MISKGNTSVLDQVTGAVRGEQATEPGSAEHALVERTTARGPIELATKRRRAEPAIKDGRAKPTSDRFLAEQVTGRALVKQATERSRVEPTSDRFRAEQAIGRALVEQATERGRAKPASDSFLAGLASGRALVELVTEREPASEGGVVEQALIDLLDRGRGADQQSELRSRLARAAGERGLIDVAYRTIETGLGSLLLASTPVGLVRVAYAVEGHDQVLADLAERIGPRVLHAPGRLDRAAHQIEEYLHRDRRSFDLTLDLRLASGFRHAVLAHLQDIDYGSTASYAAVAAAAGSPRAVRAVGTACARNPLPVVVPCHRVVRSDGTPGQYVGGAEAKRTLLALESAAPAGAMG